MLSRSSTSSPDILGPTGDSDYLISSPFKPFRGRQSAMSPNLKVLQTPGTVKGKAPRFSLSPSKSAHSIRFDDVLLPVSPHMKLNPAQRALSPDKAQLDGNQSPWRIRVTLEATQDEDEAQGSPARKRARQSTMTTKVPLKDESEQTPRRRRGRPRKSDVIEPTATPTPAPPTGGPGHTPGPAGHTPAPVGASGQKRKRGRPRKSQPQIEAPETNGQVHDEQAQDEPAPDEQLEEPAPIAEPTRSWSPLNLAAENDDDFDDELPDAPDPFDFADHAEEPAETNPPRSSPRVTLDTPNVDTIDDAYLRIGEPNLDSTPSKMPSPPREEHRSPENALHAGHTPMPPRRYPTPNSSSQMGDERPGGPGATDPALDVPDRANGPVSADPTDEHREFDSIMESEGFSMVSLDTLPSAKQHGLSTSSDLKAKKGSLKPFMNKEITTSSKRKPRFTRDEMNDEQNAQGDSPAVIERQSHLRTHSNTSNPAVRYPSLHDRQSSPRDVQLPPAAVPAATAAPTPPRVPVKQKPLARLVKLVRAGIELGHVLFNSFEFPPPAELHALQGRDPDLDAPIRRLERLFIDFDPEIQRRLHMSLDFGHEIARIRILDEIDAEIEARELVPSPPRGTQNDRAVDGSATPSAPEDLDRTPHETPNSEMRRRMEEWQQERDAISREIQLANSSQVIVIDSDASGHPSPDNQDNYYEDGFDSDQDSVAELEQPLEREVPQTDDPADDIDAEAEDGYEDIWQQEAHDQDSPSGRSDAGDYHQNGDQYGPESSPWKGTDYGKSSPASWTNDHDKVPSLGPSRVSQLREQDVDLSGLLREKYTPKRSRYYYGKSSPFSTASGRSPERSPERKQTSEPQIKEEEYEEVDEQEQYEENEFGEEEALEEPEYQAQQDFRSDNYLETSPHRFSDDDAFQVDPTTRFENSLHNPDSPAGESEDGSFVYAARSEQPSAQKTHDITPQRSQAGSADAPPSTWFQRIASLTPAWLKAPNRKPMEQPEPSVEGQSDYGHDEPTPSKEPSYNEEDTPRPVENAEWEETPRPARQSTTSTRDRRSSFQPSSGHRSGGGRPSLDAKSNGQTYDRPPPLSVSGYFSDEHYYLLRRLYRAAIKFPERFPYYPAPGRSDIIGDWIWTSDGTYGVPITERQFAIIDRFVQELAKTDIQAGGTGQVSWTEADLHRRLISIIIGEQIRAEAKEQQRQQAEPPKTQTSTIRGLTSRLWR